MQSVEQLFMDIKRPLEAIYDLLEVTLFLYVKHSVLHRDISFGNLLRLDSGGGLRHHRSTTGLNSVLSIIYWIQHKSSVIYISRGRLLSARDTKGYNSTSTLLIDFDRGEIVDIGHGEVHSEKGTPIFVARAVRAGKPQDNNRRLPELSPTARTAYEKVFPGLLTRFQHSPDESQQ